MMTGPYFMARTSFPAHSRQLDCWLIEPRTANSTDHVVGRVRDPTIGSDLGVSGEMGTR